MVKLIAPFGVTSSRFRFLIKDFRGVVVCECDQLDHANTICKLLNLVEEKHYAPPESQTTKTLDVG